MANNVFANGREISCKSGSGKSIAAFPDVCMTPPENPATPPGVPVPYPNTGNTSDCTSGSTTVKISDKEAMLKNKSYFKKSMGDEAGSAAKKGVVTSVNRGKVYFTAWSMDVKIEGENAVRHLDMTTHNHGSAMNTPPWMFMDDMTLDPTGHPCEKEIRSARHQCKGAEPPPPGSAGPRDCSKARNPKKCKKAMSCILVPKGEDKRLCCKPTNTGHHMIEDNWVRKGRHPNKTARPGFGGYDYDAAPCVCANRRVSRGSVHRRMHNLQGAHEESFLPAAPGRPAGRNYDPSRPSNGFDYGQGRDCTVKAHKQVFKSSKCRSKCVASQLDAYYVDQLGASESTTLKRPARRRGLGGSTRRRLSPMIF